MHILVKKNVYHLPSDQFVPLSLLMHRGPKKARRKTHLPTFWRLTGLRPRYEHLWLKLLLRAVTLVWLYMSICTCALQLSQWIKYTIVHMDNFEERLALVCRLVDIMVVRPSIWGRRSLWGHVMMLWILFTCLLFFCVYMYVLYTVGIAWHEQLCCPFCPQCCLSILSSLSTKAHDEGTVCDWQCVFFNADPWSCLTYFPWAPLCRPCCALQSFWVSLSLTPLLYCPFILLFFALSSVLVTVFLAFPK